MVERICLFNARQPRARNVQFEIAQFLCSLAIGDTSNASHEVIFRGSQRFDLEVPRAVLRFQRTIACDRSRILRKGPQFYFAAHAMRGSETRNTNFVRWGTRAHGKERRESQQFAVQARHGAFPRSKGRLRSEGYNATRPCERLVLRDGRPLQNEGTIVSSPPARPRQTASLPWQLASPPVWPHSQRMQHRPLSWLLLPWLCAPCAGSLFPDCYASVFS